MNLPSPNDKFGSNSDGIVSSEPEVADTPALTPQHTTKNSAAVQLGRLGGLKGGPARARKLSKQQRSDIARKAARARWQQRPPS